MMALALALVGETVPKARMGSAMGLLGAMSAAGTALGPTLGGALVSAFGRRAIFLVNVPLGAITFLAARRAPLTVLTAGYALFQAANNAAVMGDAEAERRGVVSGLRSLSRNLGLVTGASVMGNVFALAAGVPDVASADPGSVAQGTRVTFAVAAALIMAALAIGASSRSQSAALLEEPK